MKSAAIPAASQGSHFIKPPPAATAVSAAVWAAPVAVCPADETTLLAATVAAEAPPVMKPITSLDKDVGTVPPGVSLPMTMGSKKPKAEEAVEPPMPSLDVMLLSKPPGPPIKDSI